MRSIRVYLVALVVICLLVAASAFAVVVAQVNSANRQQVEAQTRETARALSQAVDAKLERAAGLLAALSISRAAAEHDWPRLDRQARAALPDADMWIVVQDRRGRQLVNTRLPTGTSLPGGSPPKEMWDSISRGGQHICNLAGGVVEPHIVCVDAPIGGGQSPEYSITAVFKPSAFSSTIARQDIDDGDIATLVDRDEKVIWRNIKPQRFIGQSATGPILDALRSGSPSGVLKSKSLEGVPMLTAYNRSSLSGWSVIVGSPLSKVQAGGRKTLMQGSLLFLAVMTFAAALAVFLGTKLHLAVRALVGASTPDHVAEPLKPSGIKEIDLVGEALRKAFAARADSERHMQMLIGELNHRVKNTLSVVQSLAYQTFRGSSSPKDAIAAFEARLQALASAHNLLTEQKWESASMRQIVQVALKPFCDLDRCEIDGPDVKLSPQMAVSLALAVHELSTNATKYGALSTETGRILVNWDADDGKFVLLWRETGGPPVKLPEAEGFGMRLIRRSLAAELKGHVDVQFLETGVAYRIEGRLA